MSVVHLTKSQYKALARLLDQHRQREVMIQSLTDEHCSVRVEFSAMPSGDVKHAYEITGNGRVRECALR